MNGEKYQPKYAPVKSITIKSVGRSKRVLARVMKSLGKGDFHDMLTKTEKLPQTITINTDSAFLYDSSIDLLIELGVDYKCHN